MADKKFSELETASEIKNSDFMALSQDTGNGLVSLKATILALATKMLTAINFTSALSTTDKTVIGAINEVAQGGGGGGAGHTILDDDGTALAQEDDLQFKGVYSVDNSTDGVTEVNVYREMTKAEFDLLSDDEKKGFINVTDEPSMASIIDGVFIDVSNLIYSTSQSGTDTYTATQDCYVMADVVTKSNAVGTVKIDDVLIGEFFYTSGSTNIETYGCYLKKGQTIKVEHGDTANHSFKVYGIQQGSQIVDYHEYSTDERIVGKWIDGRPVYEQTFHVVNATSSFPDFIDLKAISDVDVMLSIAFTFARDLGGGNIMYYSGVGATQPEFANNQYCFLTRYYNGYVQYRIGTYGTAVTDMWFTVRYLKSAS